MKHSELYTTSSRSCIQMNASHYLTLWHRWTLVIDLLTALRCHKSTKSIMRGLFICTVQKYCKTYYRCFVVCLFVLLYINFISLLQCYFSNTATSTTANSDFPHGGVGNTGSIVRKHICSSYSGLHSFRIRICFIGEVCAKQKGTLTLFLFFFSTNYTGKMKNKKQNKNKT